jgi:hypothetical protein
MADYQGEVSRYEDQFPKEAWVFYEKREKKKERKTKERGQMSHSK